MKINVLTTGSKGNCIILEHENSKLILEAGVTVDRVLKAIDYNIKSVTACLVTHSHKDHAKELKKFINLSIPVYASEETFKAYQLKSGYGLNAQNTPFKLDGWQVASFPTIHDAEGSRGYLIGRDDIKILFVTDTGYIPVKIDGLTHMIVECNYIDELLEQDEVDDTVKERIFKNHLSLKRLKSYLGKIDTSRLELLLVAHTSSRNSDDRQILNELTELLGDKVKIFIAKEGGIYE